MIKYISNNYKLVYIIEGFLLFLILSFLFYYIGFYNFCYQEQWSTFIYSSEYINEILSQPGGTAQLVSKFVIQFFVSPLSGVMITSFILTLIAILTSDILRVWTSNRSAFVISLFPVVALTFLHYNVNYSYAGTIAILFMLIFLRIYLLIDKFHLRFIYSLCSTLLLFVIAAPVASLYSLLLFIMEQFRLKWKSLLYLFVPVVVLLAAGLTIRLGLSGEWKHLLLPYGFFTLRLQAGTIVYMPWITILVVFLVSGLFKSVTLTKRWMAVMVSVSLFVGVLLFADFGIRNLVDRKNEVFKQLNYYACTSQWNKIISLFETIPAGNLLYQNYLNVALAEKGELANTLFKEPCYDIQTIYVVSNKTPYVSALLSDVYFSMGHMAMSQRCAFEANEGVGNYSPRLLQRLVQINIIYGAYGVADKYIRLLENTIFYRKWADAQKKFLWNDKAVEADPLLGSKRRCLFPDNRFSGIKGLDDDLKQIIIQNPSHKTTIQYLGCLYLLSKDMIRFMETMDRFYKTEALPDPLPLYFQEGVAAFASGNKDILNRYNIDNSVVERFKAFMQQPNAYTSTLWYFLRYRN